jgi:hypothetical protein
VAVVVNRTTINPTSSVIAVKLAVSPKPQILLSVQESGL